LNFIDLDLTKHAFVWSRYKIVIIRINSIISNEQFKLF